MERLVAFFTMLFSLFSLLTRCASEELDRYVSDDNFYCEIIDENNIAIGNVKTYPKDGAVFFPEQIKGYTVSKIGFPSGMGFGGNGYLSANKEGEPNIQRCYFPHTIKKVKGDYGIHLDYVKLFYCGEVTDLGGFYAQYGYNEIYVPAEKYELFKNALTSKGLVESLFKAKRCLTSRNRRAKQEILLLFVASATASTHSPSPSC